MSLVYKTPIISKNTTSKSLEALGCKLQEKFVEYAQNAQFVILPDEGYDGMSKVNVSVDIVVPTVQNKKIFTASIGKNTIKPDSGFDVMEEVEVNGEMTSKDLGIVSSKDIFNIVVLTQSEYDSIAEKDKNTQYLIVE